MKLRVLATLVATTAALVACKVEDPLYCDAENGCRDPARPFCDTKGEYPASEGVARTCIPDPSDVGADGDAGGNGSSDAGGGNPADAQPQSDGAAGCAWTPLDRLSEVSTTDREGGPTLDFSELNLYFFRQASGFGVYQASRSVADQEFSKPSLVPDVQAYDPELSSSGSLSSVQMVNRSPFTNGHRRLRPSGRVRLSGCPERARRSRRMDWRSTSSTTMPNLCSGPLVQQQSRRGVTPAPFSSCRATTAWMCQATNCGSSLFQPRQIRSRSWSRIERRSTTCSGLRCR